MASPPAPEVPSRRIRAVAMGFGAGALGLVLALPALAGSGRREIDQTCAVATGCFSGDAPGFPVTIDGSAGHSYLLTSDLSVTDPDANGIAITADAVFLDLGGFSLSGPVTCVGGGSEVSCSSGAGTGISAAGTLGVAVRNGRVRGFADDGVRLGEGARIEAVTAEANGSDGIEVGSGSLVLDSQGHRNGINGIRNPGPGMGSVFASSTAQANGNDGLQIDAGSVIVGNTGRANGRNGVRASHGAVVRENTASDNEQDGVYVLLHVLVSDNVSFDNGEDGISGSSAVCLQRNTSSGNGGYGVDGVPPPFQAQLRENSVHDNALGTCDYCLDVGGNVCDGSTSCP